MNRSTSISSSTIKFMKAVYLINIIWVTYALIQWMVAGIVPLPIVIGMCMIYFIVNQFMGFKFLSSINLNGKSEVDLNKDV